MSPARFPCATPVNPTRGRRTPPATPPRIHRAQGFKGDACPPWGTHVPSGFSKAGKLECYPRPVSIWCPPAHKAITMFLADRDRSSIRITAFYGALPLRHAGFFSPPSGIELGSSDCVCFFCVLFLCAFFVLFLSGPQTTTPHRQSSASRRKCRVAYRYMKRSGGDEHPLQPHHTLFLIRVKKDGLVYLPFPFFLVFDLLTAFTCPGLSGAPCEPT